MINNYDVVKFNNDFSHIIFSTSHETPFHYLDEIADTLYEEGVSKAEILFDLLLSKGNSSQRFIVGKYEDGNFVQDSFYVLKVDENHAVRKFSCEYLKSRPYLLEHSVLNSYQKGMLMKGVII